MCQVCQKNESSNSDISAISSLQELNALIECLNARAAKTDKFVEQLIWVVVGLVVAIFGLVIYYS